MSNLKRIAGLSAMVQAMLFAAGNKVFGSDDLEPGKSTGGHWAGWLHKPGLGKYWGNNRPVDPNPAKNLKRKAKRLIGARQVRREEKAGRLVGLTSKRVHEMLTHQVG